MGGIPGAPANSPIGQAVMNTVLPGVGTAAAEMGKDEIKVQTPRASGPMSREDEKKALHAINALAEVSMERRIDLQRSNADANAEEIKYLDSFEDSLYDFRDRYSGD